MKNTLTFLLIVLFFSCSNKEFDKNKNVKFYKNGVLVSKKKYLLLGKDMTVSMQEHIKFSKKGIYAIYVRENGILTLTKGYSHCIDCGTDVYKKIE